MYDNETSDPRLDEFGYHKDTWPMIVLAILTLAIMFTFDCYGARSMWSNGAQPAAVATASPTK